MAWKQLKTLEVLATLWLHHHFAIWFDIQVKKLKFSVFNSDASGNFLKDCVKSSPYFVEPHTFWFGHFRWVLPLARCYVLREMNPLKNKKVTHFSNPPVNSQKIGHKPLLSKEKRRGCYSFLRECFLYSLKINSKLVLFLLYLSTEIYKKVSYRTVHWNEIYWY